MISAWDKSEDKLQAAQEKAFGSEWRFRPRLARPNKPTIADPLRQARRLRAVFMRPHSFALAGRECVQHSTGNPALEVRASVLNDIQQGDHFERLDAAGEVVEVYECAVPKWNGHGMATVELIQLGRSDRRR
jgi:hypothetical protein